MPGARSRQRQATALRKLTRRVEVLEERRVVMKRRIDRIDEHLTAATARLGRIAPQSAEGKRLSTETATALTIALVDLNEIRRDVDGLLDDQATETVA